MSLTRTNQAVDHPGDQAVSGNRLPRGVQRQVDIATGRSIVTTTRINGAAFATRTAIVNIALLSQEEEQLIAMAPLAEGRMKAVVDAYALLTLGEINSLRG